jgi:hypothetical protein
VSLVDWPMITDFGVALVLEREREEREGEEKVKIENNKIILENNI